MHDIELDGPRVGHVREHARKAFRECAHCFPRGYPDSLEKAVEVLLPDFQLIPLDNELPRNVQAVTLREDRLIGYNSKLPRVRVRFSIAHELGHIRLDHPDWILGLDPKEGKPYETEAHMFAGEFLVPLSSLKAAFKTCRDPNELAKQFNVSREVMFIRFKDARLLSKIV